MVLSGDGWTRGSVFEGGRCHQGVQAYETGDTTSSDVGHVRLTLYPCNPLNRHVLTGYPWIPYSIYIICTLLNRLLSSTELR